jgi:hypothetical protein
MTIKNSTQFKQRIHSSGQNWKPAHHKRGANRHNYKKDISSAAMPTAAKDL